MRPLVTLAILFVPMAVGQTTGEDPKFTARSNLVFLPTRVQTRQGTTIYGLKAEQFIVEDNGVRQAVSVDDDPESTGLSLVVVIQCSRSAVSEFNKLKGLGAMIDAIARKNRICYFSSQGRMASSLFRS